jgi:hypothetical protein
MKVLRQRSLPVVGPGDRLPLPGDGAADYESGGQEFESLRARQKLNKNRAIFML